jgi:hypothetical protein
MRVMVIVKATKNSEAGILPSEKMLAEMGKFNEELVKAGVMLAGDGLHPSVKGKRVRFAGGKKTVVDGPFAETKELIAGYWIWQVKSMEEAVEWVKRCPDPMPGEESEIEIRPAFEAEDFGEEYTPELRANDERLRVEIERQRSSLAERGRTCRNRQRARPSRPSGESSRPGSSAASRASFATSGSPKISPKRRSSSPSSSGPRRASPIGPGPGSWPRPRTAQSTT